MKQFFPSNKHFFYVATPLFCLFLLQFVQYKILHSGGFYICNKGISFGFIPQNGSVVALIVFALLFLCLFLIAAFFKKNLLFLLPGFVFLLIGAFSNVLDRFFQGCIIDYLFLPFLPKLLFNVADIFIFIGTILFLSALFSKKRPL